MANEGLGGRELISFRIGDQELCIDITSVREIRGWAAVTPLPHAPDYVCGVINLRGAIIPVLDLKRRLGLGVTEPGLRHVIVVTQIRDSTVGLLVDGVSETFKVSEADLHAPPEIGSNETNYYVQALISMGDRILTQLVVVSILPKGALDMPTAA